MIKMSMRTGRKITWGSAAIVALYVDITADGGISFWVAVYGLGTAVIMATILGFITKR